MTKRKSLEAMLKAKFRWPTKGDKLVVAAEDPHDNAHIHIDGRVRLAGMMSGYKMAADLAVAEAKPDGWKRNQLVYPIIFNYRQFLELSLKHLIATFGPRVGIGPNWNTHDLAELWEQFSEILDIYSTSDPDSADPVVEETILEFSKIDPDSYSYRYPVDRKGNPLPVSCKELHLPNLADVMDATAHYFDGCELYLSEQEIV